MTLVPLLLATFSMTSASQPSRPQLLIHVMPWFVVDSSGPGWHWRMNKTAEELRGSGRVASHYRPLVGAYDSLNPDVVELQVGWMKIAGFDGVLADWYGTQPHFDYPDIHKRTVALFDVATRAGMKIGVVYEDQTVKNAISQKLINEDRKLPIARETGEFLRANWLKSPNWIKLGGKPSVFVFGPQSFGVEEWKAFRMGTGDISLLTLHNRLPYAEGGYDWPIPSEGLAFQKGFGPRSKDWPVRVPVAFPRFRDYYEEGGQKGYPDLPDDDGRTYTNTLSDAIALNPPAVQVATWNDWQEGTQIEPSTELGMRDLVATQVARRKIDPAFKYTEKDLELPLQLFRLRQTSKEPGRLKPIGDAILSGDLAKAKALLAHAR